MKKMAIYLFIASTILGLSSCHGKKSEPAVGQPTSITDIPPSIQAESQVKAVIRLSDEEINQLNIETTMVTSELQKFTLSASGIVFPAAGHVAIISTPINGRISAIRVNDGHQVQKGAELFRIESLEFGSMVSEYLQAVAEDKFQSKRMERLEQLVKQTISSESELDRAKTDYQRASASVIAAYAKLKAIGVGDSEISAMRNAETIDPTLKIHAPVSGMLDNREVELGQAVDALQKLARIVDLGEVQIKGYLSPEDAVLVSVGDSVWIGQRQSDSNPIVAQVSSINPGLDENNRSVVANIVIATRNGWPKPGENVKLEIKTSTLTEQIAVPVDALTYDGNDPILFVKVTPSSYEQRKITIKAIRGRLAVVDTGVEKGEEIAISQVFSLKALSRYEQIAEE